MIYFSGFQTGFLSAFYLYESPVEFVDVKIASSMSLKPQLHFLFHLKSASS